jgi:hypothetical protein
MRVVTVNFISIKAEELFLNSLYFICVPLATSYAVRIRKLKTFK